MAWMVARREKSFGAIDSKTASTCGRSAQSSAVDRAEDGFRGAGDGDPVVVDGERPVDQPRVVQQVVGHGGDGSARRLRQPV